MKPTYHDLLVKAGTIKRENIPFQLDVHEFKALVARVTNTRYAESIQVVQLSSMDGMDEYEISDGSEGLLIQATSGVAAASALNHYLKYYCNYTVGALFRTGELPAVPPKVGTVVHKKTPFHYRYLYNYCTFGYTYAFYDWEKWEQVLDWALLSGYNLLLNPIAQESVWFELLQEIGYTKENAKKFLVGPAFMPWLLMMNMSKYNGEYPDWWFENQKELAGKFNQRLQAFGANVLLPGYCGMVPDDFGTYFPDSHLIDQGLWCGLKRPAYLLPDDPMFAKIASLFYTIQGKIAGAKNAHYYSTDPFHEGGISDGIDLGAYAKAVFACMEQYDEKAVWAFQGWQINPRREMLDALDKSRTLIMNLIAETNFNAGDEFGGCPWIYCTVNNFGGQHLLRGHVQKSLQRPYDGLNGNHAMVGVGIMPESVETDEVFYDIISEIIYREEKLNAEEYLASFVKRRYGKYSDNLYKAWKILSEQVYLGDLQEGGNESAFCSRPSLIVDRVSKWGGTVSVQNPQILIEVVRRMLTEYEDCKSSTAYRYDLVDFTRQLMANDSWRLVYGMQKAYDQKEKEEFLKLSSRFLGRFDLMEELLKTHEHFLLSRWLEPAKKLGRNELEKRWFEWNARTQITVWAPKTGEVLHDYAAKEWAGMVRDFYKPRWEAFVSMMELSLFTEEPITDYERYDQEVLFSFGRKSYETKPTGDTKIVVTSVLKEVEEGLCL